jgi:hypothetical protein
MAVLAMTWPGGRSAVTQPHNRRTAPTEAVADLYERFLAPLSDLGSHRSFTPCAWSRLLYLVAECTYPAVDSWRKSCVRSLRGIVLKLTSALAEEREWAGRPGLSIFDRAATAVQNTDFDSAQGDFLLFRNFRCSPVA